jgi:hypothetical protein
MKAFAIAAFSIGAALSVGAAQAQGMQAQGMQGQQDPNHRVCLNIEMPNAVDHTKTVDASTILFYMRDGKIWKNTLKTPCPGLEFHGFSYATHYSELCGNEGISVIETHQVCSLGNFTPYTPPPDQHASLR